MHGFKWQYLNTCVYHESHREVKECHINTKCINIWRKKRKPEINIFEWDPWILKSGRLIWMTIQCHKQEKMKYISTLQADTLLLQLYFVKLWLYFMSISLYYCSSDCVHYGTHWYPMALQFCTIHFSLQCLTNGDITSYSCDFQPKNSKFVYRFKKIELNCYCLTARQLSPPRFTIELLR